MYDYDGGRTVALIIIGAYLGAVGYFALSRYWADRSRVSESLFDLGGRVFKLENPDLGAPDDDAEES